MVVRATLMASRVFTSWAEAQAKRMIDQIMREATQEERDRILAWMKATYLEKCDDGQ